MMSITANKVKLIVRISSNVMLVEGVEVVEVVEVYVAFYYNNKLSNYFI